MLLLPVAEGFCSNISSVRDYLFVQAFSYFFFSFFFVSQDGKTAEDLAYADQHELIVSLLGKLKKVKSDTHTPKPISKCDK